MDVGNGGGRLRISRNHDVVSLFCNFIRILRIGKFAHSVIGHSVCLDGDFIAPFADFDLIPLGSPLCCRNQVKRGSFVGGVFSSAWPTSSGALWNIARALSQKRN